MVPSRRYALPALGGRRRHAVPAAHTQRAASQAQRLPQSARRCSAAAGAGPSRTASGASASSSDGDETGSSGGGPVNKRVIGHYMDDRLYDYLLQHTREPDVLRRLREETATLSGGRMQISPEQGQFMRLLIEVLGARRAIEVGVFTGYSSLVVAMALPEDGRLVACDRDAAAMEVAKRYWRDARVDHKVDARVGPALDSLRQLLASEGKGSFDFAFIDADKRGYRDYYELCLELVRPGGLVAVDNVLWYGKVADPEVNDKPTLALRQLNAELVADERVTMSVVPIGDGMTLCRKR